VSANKKKEGENHEQRALWMRQDLVSSLWKHGCYQMSPLQEVSNY